MASDNRFWFAAKRYRWGWGLPIAFQGWVAFLIFLGSVVAGSFVVPPRHSMAGYLISFVVVAVLFAAACWWKGEPPGAPVPAAVTRPLRPPFFPGIFLQLAELSESGLWVERRTQ